MKKPPRTRKQQGKKALVLGGCGFLGRHLCQELLNRGYNQVIAYDLRRGRGFDLDERDDRCKVVLGDLEDSEKLTDAMQDVFAVFHTASPPYDLEDRNLFYKVNVLGTKKVIACCHAAQVPRLVLTSSCSVVYNGKDIENGDEQLPYATKPQDYYTETKILQEKIVLEANGSRSDDSDPDYRLATVTCRPHGIFGPDDPNVVPTIVKMAQTGKTRFAIGDGSNLVDETYVKNVAYGHYVAAEALQGDGIQKCSGQAYNITQDEPIQFWTFMSIILTTLGYDAPKYYLPYGFLYAMATIVAYILKFLRATVAPKLPPPTFTPMRVALAGTHHYYSCAKAKKLLGYKPYIPLKQAIEETLATFEHLKNTSSNKSD